MQAKKGGQLGINGEQYKGGQFLPNHKDTVKGATKRPQSKGKQPVAPYKWELPPSPDHFSIFKLIESAIRWIEFGVTCEIHAELLRGEDAEHFASFGFFINLADLVARYNVGERWADMSEAELYTPQKIS